MKIAMTQQVQHEHKWTVTPDHHWQCDMCGKKFGWPKTFQFFYTNTKL